ncbi:MAG: response regulator transcription factor [Gammaproteobacteria bacterium]|nr:response regulator transcription factor [Gammaproteobacteria bacterium]
MKEKLSILVVEDEAAIRTGLVDVLLFHGYDVDATADGKEGLDKAQTGRFDLILLDVMLPSMNGFDVCEAIRATDPAQPIIMLTAKVSDEDIVQGLKLGADDYVAKPFSVEQLVLRVAAVLRRSRAGHEQATHIHLGRDRQTGIEIDTVNLLGSPNDASAQTVAFTRREMEMLVYLHANSERPVPREELLNQVWGYARNLDIETRTVDIHIAKLRRKLEPDPKNPIYLCTIRGAGYRLISTPAVE